jgi:Four helix bundle sensory module for signal transduction
MPNRVFLAPDSEMPVVRQLKLLVGILVISNIALGIYGFYFLRAIDRKYSTLIEQAVPTMNDLQELTAVTMRAMRTTNPILFGDSPQVRSEMSKRARSALQRDRDLRGQLLGRQWLPQEADERLGLERTGDAFSKAADEVVDLLESGAVGEASQRRENSLRPAFDLYIAAVTKLADDLQDQSLRASDVLSVKTGSISNMMLGLASWPLIIFGVLLLVTAIFATVVLLNVFFRRNETI